MQVPILLTFLLLFGVAFFTAFHPSDFASFNFLPLFSDGQPAIGQSSLECLECLKSNRTFEMGDWIYVDQWKVLLLN